MCPRCCCCPEEYSLGVIPSHDINSRALANRAKSPISAINPSAVSVAIPRNRTSTCTWSAHRPSLASRSSDASSNASCRSSPVEVDQHLLKRRMRERIIQALTIDPLAVLLSPRVLALPPHPAIAQQLLEHPVTRRDP